MFSQHLCYANIILKPIINLISQIFFKEKFKLILYFIVNMTDYIISYYIETINPKVEINRLDNINRLLYFSNTLVVSA